MRVQLQRGTEKTYASNAYDFTGRGVTVKHIWKATTELWNSYKHYGHAAWFSSKHETAFIKGLAFTTKRAEDIYRSGGIDKTGTIGTFQWQRNDPKGTNARSATSREAMNGYSGYYRVDFENMKNPERLGVNLKHYA
ncbi:MAG: hypothetical protein HC838_00615 [Spirulinaceae cyanobacterium RM2_2_10]|nr:hypothetical protein [Spirulinaceae cyanobacterium RM2_2_10]